MEVGYLKYVGIFILMVLMLFLRLVNIIKFKYDIFCGFFMYLLWVLNIICICGESRWVCFGMGDWFL